MRGFLEWWLRNLIACVPAAWRAAAQPDALVVSVADPGHPASARVVERRRGKLSPERPLSAPRSPDIPVMLRAWPGAVLRRTVTLPLAVRDADLARVLSYEMDRLTPFAAGEVAFGSRVLARDRAAQTQTVALALIPRATLDPVLAALRDASVTPSAIEDGEDRIVLRSQAARPALARTGLIAACALLALVAILLPFARQSAALGAARDAIEALQPAVREAETLRRKLAGDTQGGDVAAAEEARVGNALAVIGTVTTLLPDDTYLNEFTLRQGRLTIGGQSSSAPRLLALLAADPSLHDPTFTAPVTRIEASQIGGFGFAAPPPQAAEAGPAMDLFAIRADLVL